MTKTTARLTAAVNALTGWQPRPSKPLPFLELEEERDRAERVKQDTPILVVLGNPPYNGFAGVAMEEERELSAAYRTTKRVRCPEGQGLNYLYVRFFRMAERRIAQTGQGVVCFISNYSWLNGLSHTGMRELAVSATRGRELARLLDPDAPVPGVTQGALRPALAVPATADGRNMIGDDFALTAGWGHFAAGDAVMPGQGRLVEREYTPDERTVLGDALPVLGEKTLDVYLNDRACWCNVPAAVWNYKLGGYQVLKKWLSYRERDVLGRVLTPEEVSYFAEVTRRIGAVLSSYNAVTMR